MHLKSMPSKMLHFKTLDITGIHALTKYKQNINIFGEDMTNLTLDLVIEHLGQPIRKNGSEYEWQCPICKDRGKDNLKFNSQKGVLYCFADESHARTILRGIMRNHKDYLYSKDKKEYVNRIVEAEKYQENKITPEKQKIFLNYMFECNASLLNDSKVLEFLRNRRGITQETVSNTGMGIDKVKRHWTIPTFRYGTGELIGFEYRPPDLSKKGLCREKNTPTGLAEINCYTPQTEILVIVEGYFDGYALLQHLTEINQIAQYHIVTPSNGVQGLLRQIKCIDFRKYKRFELFIDNDETSRPIANKIIEQYPMFHNVELKCGCKDFNEHYLKCIKKERI